MANIAINKILLLGTLFWQISTAVTFASPVIIYNPPPIRFNQTISDQLSTKDIPTGDGGFQRDYRIFLQSGDQITIDVISQEFDTMIDLIGSDGSTIGENDDGPDGTSNSLLFARIQETGEYIVRVRSFNATGTGEFTLKVTRLRPVNK
jgi:Bacterial pre-peptidase C-terminal domain